MATNHEHNHTHLQGLPAYVAVGEDFTTTHEVTGQKFRVDIQYDGCSRAPEQDCDGHGLTLDLSWCIGDYDNDELLEKLGFEPDEGSPEAMEQLARYRMMRLLRDDDWRSDYKYYDVWETLKVARRDRWGNATTVEEAQAAVDRDYEYLHGWYTDEWFWGVLCVVMLDEDGEETEHEQYLGMVEITGDMTDYLKECIADMVDELHWAHRAAVHKGQLELNLNPVGSGETHA